MATLGTMFGGAAAGTFLGLPAWDGRPGPRAVILGADTATPYPAVGPYCAGGAAAIRAGSEPFAGLRGHWHFDFGRVAVPERSVADAGDVPVGPDAEANRAAIGLAVEGVLAAGAVPILLGGDDSVSVPFLGAFYGHAPVHGLTVLQIDAHVDWRDDVEGERLGLSSVMRRASEMRHIGAMVQVGARGLGSARAEEAAAMAARGVRQVTARALHAHGVAAAVAAVPAGAPVVVCLDWDAVDPAAMPAVIARTAGGLTFGQVLDLAEGVAAKAPLAGIVCAEFMPARDIDGQGAGFAAQVVTAFLSLLTAGR